LCNIYIQTEEIEDVLAFLDVTKATDPDQINSILLKEASSTLCYPLCKIFNMSLENSIFPEKWKNANVIPVNKKDQTSDVKKYRPISLLCIVAKVMERCVHHHIYDL
jgi:sarcosine oxidase/L-pipecolate oxidase